MKKLLILLCTTLLAHTAMAQEVDPSQIDPQQLGGSDIHTYFQGPLELYVTGIEFEGDTYAVILDYDGGSTVSVVRPEETTTEGKPRSIDLSEAEFAPTGTGIRVSNIIVDGYYYSGTFVHESDRELRLTALDREGYAETRESELLSELERLETQLEERNRRIARLNRQIEELPEQERITELREQTRELEDTLEERQQRVSELQSRLEDRESRIEQLEQRVDSLRSTVDTRESRIERLQQQIEELPAPEVVSRLRGQVNDLEAELASAQSRMSSLRSEIDQKDRRIQSLNDRLSNLRDPWVIAEQNLTTSLRSEFQSGTSMIGVWQASDGSLEQNDQRQRFAKYALPVVQPNTDLMYTITGEATGEGWAGYGFHFLANDWESGRRYGLGRSYLLWVTRDEGVMGNVRTYVQLYRSFDDVRMDLLASAAIEPPISSPITIDVYVDRSNNTISAIADGTHAFSYQDDSILRSGRIIAVRSLGTTRITELTLLTE